MRSLIRMIALAILIATSLFWFTQGAQTGWTRRAPSAARVEPVTGIKISEKIPRIVPGIDFLGGSMAVVVFLFVFSYTGGGSRRRRTEQLVPLADPETSEADVAPADTEAEPDPDASSHTEGPSPKEII